MLVEQSNLNSGDNWACGKVSKAMLPNQLRLFAVTAKLYFDLLHQLQSLSSVLSAIPENKYIFFPADIKAMKRLKLQSFLQRKKVCS